MLSSVAPSVKKRRVFYISGYDPRGVRTCYSTCKEHAALYKGDTLRVSRRRKEGPYATGWTIASDAGAETHMTFLHWDDIIRDHWPKNPFKLTFSALRAYAVYITNGAALQALRCTPAIFLAFLYPITALIMIQLTSFAIASIGYNGVIAADYGTLPAYIVAAVLFTVTFLSLYPLAEKIKAFWLLRIYIFFTSSKGSFGDIYQQRCHIFSDQIKSAIADVSYDEILVVSHSTGVVGAMSATALALEQAPDERRLAMLTLGQCVQVHSCDKRAVDIHRYRDILSAHPFFWLDVSSPPDGAAFALTDPSEGKKKNIRIISPQFHKAFPKKEYAALKRDFFRLHFQYIMTTPLPVAYDYFAILTGTMTLEERYASA